MREHPERLRSIAEVSLRAARECVNRNILTLQRISAMMWAFHMIRSMTGFGRAEVSGEAIVGRSRHARSNHRHLDVALRLPARHGLEMEARRSCSRAWRAGASTSRADPPIAGRPPALAIDTELAASTSRARVHSAASSAIAATVTLAWVDGALGVARLEEGEPVEPAAPWPVLADALARALDEMVARAPRRRAAGRSCAAHTDLTAHVTVMGVARARGGRAPRRTAARAVARAPAGQAIDDARLLSRRRSGGTRRTSRRSSRASARAPGEFTSCSTGRLARRQLDFLLQELNREVNTVGSKADDLEMSQAAGAKSALEKIREQVQNLE